MIRRTTIEIDEDLLERAKRALGAKTTRATVEEALRLAADAGEGAADQRRAARRRYLSGLSKRADLDVLASEEMWR
jgi:Arc/MetJ family transcription regulator